MSKVGRPAIKPEKRRTGVTFTLPGNVIKELDKRRGELSRGRYIEQLIKKNWRTL